MSTPAVIRTFRNDYEFLSNFYTNIYFLAEGLVWKSSEHYFMSHKNMDLGHRVAVWSAHTPREAKRLGRTTTLRSDWEEVKLDIMFKVLMAKFDEPRLQEMLIDTGDATLIEGNTWHDNIWGSCTCSKCRNTGANLLGNTLMKVRTRKNLSSVR